MSEATIQHRQREPIGIFYDGGFAEKIRQRQAWPQNFYSQLQNAIISSTVAVLRAESCYVVASNWFRGMLTSSQVKNTRAGKDEQVKFYENERRLSEELMKSGIEISRRLMPGSDKEKGIDCLLFAKAIRCIEHDKPTAIVLVAGDGDHVPLLEEAGKRGIRTISVWYQEGDIQSSDWLAQRANWSFRMSFNPTLQLSTVCQPEIHSMPLTRPIFVPAPTPPTPGRPGSSEGASS